MVRPVTHTAEVAVNNASISERAPELWVTSGDFSSIVPPDYYSYKRRYEIELAFAYETNRHRIDSL